MSSLVPRAMRPFKRRESALQWSASQRLKARAPARIKPGGKSPATVEPPTWNAEASPAPHGGSLEFVSSGKRNEHAIIDSSIAFRQSVASQATEVPSSGSYPSVSQNLEFQSGPKKDASLCVVENRETW